MATSSAAPPSATAGMQTRRPAPAPLSDELFSKPAPVLLGATNNGQPLCVKNTFVDIPSGLTPSSIRGLRNHLLTAPAMLNKKIVFPLRASGGAPPTPVLTPNSQRSVASAEGVVTPQTTSPQREILAATLQIPSPQRELTAKDIPRVSSLESIKDSAEEREEDHEDESDDEECPEGQQEQVERAEVPKPPPGALHPSIGSIAHTSGACKRCCFFPRGRCVNGYECEFCHYSHENRKRKNKKKGGKTRALPGLMPAADACGGLVSAQAGRTQPLMTYAVADGAQMAQVLLPMQSAMPVQGAVAAGQFVVCAPMQMCAMPAHSPAQQGGPMACASAAVGAAMCGSGSVPVFVQAAVPTVPQQQQQQQSAKVYRLPPAVSQVAQSAPWAGQGCAPAPPPVQSPRVRLALATQSLGSGVAPPPQCSPKFRA